MNRKRPKQIVIRMSEDEYGLLKKKIDQSGKKQQEYLIDCITNKEVLNTDGIKALLPEMNRIGVNLNQLAKHSHQGYPTMKSDIYKIGKELHDAWQLLKRLAQRQVSDEL